ncbi:FimV/HubP family polar landmark protein [Rubrivivax sp. A210]|uniref:FimV/HubP family polar landmark protein n=1 Tax=Rubrivivax sp. A210 TaxID=2772301 RepID=UPI001F1E7FB9|nr:FimV/HubP family polar landmark protein [Rubrivivax sp. A210]
MALATACLWGSHAAALGLGRLSVQSALGEALRAEIEVTSITPEEASSLKLRVAPPEAYRAAGVEYNAALPSATVQVVKRADGRQVLRLSSDRAVLEPFVDLILEATWTSGRLVREYTLLFDPPTARPAPAPSAAPVIAAPAPAPAASPATAAVAAPAPAPTAPATAVRTTPPKAAAADAPRAKPADAPKPPPAGADSVTVRPGDSLSRVAGRAQRPGVSLDQMLVSLFRTNPDAFVGENMNRLRAGAVLTVPAAAEAAKIGSQEARELIVAQSADFAAYRQRLAAGATSAAEAAPARQATGKVQTQVDDRKQAATATPDRLQLSQGGVKASAPEAKASKEAEKKAADQRVAELARNVAELKKLQESSTPAKPAAPAPAPVAAAPAPAPAPAPVAPPPASAATPALPVAVPAPPPVASAPAPAPVPASAPAPKRATPVPTPEEPSFIDSLLENSFALPAAGVLVALLGGVGLYRLRGRFRKQAGETSFLESRLQPDSFFGASGGQRVDTREASASTTGNSSSMSYSLSQLDAIGDVDPVAEADVYLAYGRDLQAEEILKEAMRATPERMAIRSKLLEVYAKRRDTKGFELLASQMFNLTHGEGEDWSKAQALGQSIDPENVLYQPGGRPDEVRGVSGQVVEPLGASTVPYTAPVAPAAFQPAADATLDGGHDDDGSIDLDLDLPLPDGPELPSEATQRITTEAALGGDSTLDFSLGDEIPGTVPVPRPVAQQVQEVPPTVALPRKPESDGLDFDLGDLTIPNTTPTAPTPAPAPDSSLDFGDFSIGSDHAPLDEPALGEGDPLSRKLELAEEFRQIGDMEGARDLLEEVVSKATGSLQAKAQGMLDKLG